MGEYLPGDIRDRIRELREGRGFTGSYVAEKLGVSVSTYTRLESGHTQKISDETISILSDLYEVPADFIIGSSNIDKTISNELEELGLTYESAARMFEGRVNMEVLNVLLQSDSFARLLNQLSIYGTEALVDGIRMVNEMKSSVLAEAREQISEGLIEDSDEFRKDRMLIEFSRDNPVQFDLERLKDSFMVVAKEYKCNIEEERKRIKEQDVYRKEILPKIYASSKAIMRDYKMPLKKKKKLLARKAAQATGNLLNAKQKEVFEEAAYEILNLQQ